MLLEVLDGGHQIANERVLRGAALARALRRRRRRCRWLGGDGGGDWGLGGGWGEGESGVGQGRRVGPQAEAVDDVLQVPEVLAEQRLVLLLLL